MDRAIPAYAVLILAFCSVAVAGPEYFDNVSARPRRPVLTIYGATWCGNCREGNAALAGNSPEALAIRAQFEIRYVDIDRPLNNLVAGTIKGIRYIPAYQVGGSVHYGFKGLPDLMGKLGMSCPVPAAMSDAPPFVPQTTQPRPEPPPQPIIIDPRPTAEPLVDPRIDALADRMRSRDEQIADAFRAIREDSDLDRAALDDVAKRLDRLATQDPAAKLKPQIELIDRRTQHLPDRLDDLEQRARAIGEDVATVRTDVLDVTDNRIGSAMKSRGWWDVATWAAGAAGLGTPIGLGIFAAGWIGKRIVAKRQERRNRESQDSPASADSDGTQPPRSRPAKPQPPPTTWVPPAESSRVAAELTEAIGTLTERIKALEHAGARPDRDDIVRMQQDLATLRKSLQAAKTSETTTRVDIGTTGVRRETEYVPVPTTDRMAEALKEAMRREAKLNPDLFGIFQRVESSASELAHGQKIIDRSPATGRPGFKTETQLEPERR